MTYDEWRERYKNRNDITSRLTHLTKGDTEDDAFHTLLKILEDKKLNGSTTSTGFIIGNKKAVCFQEAPLDAIAENLLYEKQLRENTNGKVRYLPFGIRFNKARIFTNGGRPVLYGEKELLKRLLPEEEHWRIVNYDLSDDNHMIDWSHEREWRVPGDLTFEYDDIEVLLHSNEYYRRFINYCINSNRLNILQEINGIIVMDTIFF
ncbi:MAG: hypothetical protein NC300_07705 [Bacteroidales bacterium]|nr:DUF2971 domain-containing protein [Clostridium sp.]MCM1204014.1 hypothetical protein [Bacteroidales bacterium]